MPRSPTTRSTPPKGPFLLDDESAERPTVIPEFDPAAFARDSETRQQVRPAVQPEADVEAECLDALGSLDAVLVVRVTNARLKGFALDHRAGFLLSFLDGVTRVEDVLDICGMPRLEALRGLRELLARGIVSRLSDFRRLATLPPGPDAGPKDEPSVEAKPAEDDPAEDRPNDTPDAPESGVQPLLLSIPSLDSVPVLLAPREKLELRRFTSEVRVLVSLVDDASTVWQILDRAKVDVVEGMGVFEQLADDGVIAFV